MWVDVFLSESSDHDDIVSVKTSIGDVRGRIVSAPFGHVTGATVDQFLGIPFALPPVGQLRYADPVPLDRLPLGTLTLVRWPRLAVSVMLRSGFRPYVSLTVPSFSDLNRARGVAFFSNLKVA